MSRANKKEKSARTVFTAVDEVEEMKHLICFTSNFRRMSSRYSRYRYHQTNTGGDYSDKYWWIG